MSFDFKIKTLVNEFAPVFLLMALSLLNKRREPSSAAHINASVTGFFYRSKGNEIIKYPPSLLYKIMSELEISELVQRNLDENNYFLTPKGIEYLNDQFPRINKFFFDLEDFIKEYKNDSK